MEEPKAYIDNKLIGQRIRESRELFGLSREEFAEMISLSAYYVGQLERGQRQMSLGVLANIANCLHLSLDYLVFGKTMSQTDSTINDKESYANENATSYADEAERNTTTDIRILNDLLIRCSSTELDLIEKLVKVILPYLR
ncbi:MAG: helix-turn-helix transcriptional regulator [Syntrophomonadaceae bacterium]|nr:helix-turn-helix transcriptional regulator [Syntrophomonadaceae bacterium]